MSVIDRINIGQAQVAGMREELGLTIGARYSICLLLFFPGYTIFELPSNMALVRFGVKWTMTFLIVAWGLIVMGMGFVNHWVDFIGDDGLSDRADLLSFDSSSVSSKQEFSLALSISSVLDIRDTRYISESQLSIRLVSLPLLLPEVSQSCNLSDRSFGICYL